MAMSAVASLLMPGVYAIAIFFFAAACRSMCSNPTEYVAMTLTVGETLWKKVESKRSRGVTNSASAPSAAANN